MGFLDSFKGAIKDAMSSQSSRDAAAARRLAQQAADQDPDQDAEQDAGSDVQEHVAEPQVVEYEAYTVRVGDSMPEIGGRFGVSVEEIARLNEVDNPDLIYPGQVFRIPKN